MVAQKIKIYVDVNIFIYWLADNPTYGETACQWIKKIEKSPLGTYLTSALTLYEATVIMAILSGGNVRDTEFLKKVLEPIELLPGLQIVQLENKDIIEALKLVEKYNLDLEDAIHLATALREKSTAILSNDKDFDRTPLKRIFLE